MSLRSLTPFRDRNTLARPEPSLFGSLQREIDRLFDDFHRSMEGAWPWRSDLMPSIEVAETDKIIELSVELPGLERKDVDISLEDNMLVVRGEKRIEAEKSGDAKNNGRNVQVSERSYGAFYRSIQLPPGIDPASIEATMSKGVLKVIIPKPARAQAKKIEVKEAA